MKWLRLHEPRRRWRRHITRNGHDGASRYPLIVEAVSRLKVTCGGLLDSSAMAEGKRDGSVELAASKKLRPLTRPAQSASTPGAKSKRLRTRI
jgi:hypothetical protein